MNSLRSIACLVLFAALPTISVAQDGWLFSAAPPIVVRYDSEAVAFRFTNTGDKPLHGVTLHVTRDGKETSRVIIDTIDPHKTISADHTILADVVSGATITCTNYSKPLKVPFP